MTLYAVIPDPYAFRVVEPGWPLNPGEQLFAWLPPDTSMRDAVSAIRDSIQTWLDKTAQQNDYDDAASAVSYVGDPNATFNADGIAIRDWRSAVWTAAYALEATLTANPPSPWPTADQIIAQLPKPGAYGWVVHGVAP